MNSQLNNSTDNQELERPPHFKNVFSGSTQQQQVQVQVQVQQQQAHQHQHQQSQNEVVIVVENRRPSIVVPTNINDTIATTPTQSQQMCLSNPSNDGLLSPNDLNSISETSSTNTLSPTCSIANNNNNNNIPTTSTTAIATATTNSSVPSSSSSSKFKSSSKKLRKSKTRSSKTKTLPISKRFRSRSLPNIWLPSFKQTDLLLNDLKRKHNEQHHHQQQIVVEETVLPPVNLQSLHEIDLHEILKNPQLRHDILFDPQLQFRPNLDGERGKRKKLQADKYWSTIKDEIKLILNSNKKITINSSIPLMFQTLKDILLSLLPSKDKNAVEEIMDLNLLIQQLNNSSFNFIKFSNWISNIFKMHCAPMRDLWVDEMNSIFEKSCSSETLNVDLLIEGLRVLFSILEAMKLDVANHQIRILRPLLCSTAITFEKEYFQNSLIKNKINLQQSSNWIQMSLQGNNKCDKLMLNSNILKLLSCSKMCNEFPNTLIFDHSRLILLRADIRQLTCIKICLIIYSNLIKQYNLPSSLNSIENLKTLKTEILNIIIDENGNSKWTRNLNNLAIHLIGKLFGSNGLDDSKIKFCFNWLLKQTQPSSTIYSIMEKKLFDLILKQVNDDVDVNLFNEDEGSTSTSTSANTSTDSTTSTSTSTSTTSIIDPIVDVELKGVIERLKQLSKFHYSVFSEIYENYSIM
ncbi:hypothetical protein CANARDRAFT_29307 [[Candida] arabinofermentans NRRL YB-2248]|uniref:T-complex protein 11 n=1 Tax=[Candida] arabinofermentans NRRL YB-2248 TaxID=983967 RepID=A0A1E4SXC4_9ASCO|nr:hypothetical protein CANARDRAFT_29307 [[Candida] arabinofermentans NRRL YB-2248]